MKSKILVLFLALAASALAQNVRISGWCEQGGQTITTLGYQSAASTPAQRSYPGATLAVYVTGSSPYVLATIYNAAGSAIANPTTCPSNGYYSFYAPIVQYYDLAFSGAGVPTPFTLGSVAGVITNASQLLYTAPGSGAVARTVQGKLGETVSVMDYGAVCDGSTDDSIAVQNALSNIAAGTTLQFPAMCAVGHVGWVGLNIPRSGISLEGTNGGGMKILVLPSQHLTGLPAGTVVMMSTVASPLSRVSVTNLEIDGNGVFGVNAVALGNCTDCVVEGNYFHNQYTTVGTYCTNSASYPSLAWTSTTCGPGGAWTGTVGGDGINSVGGLRNRYENNIVEGMSGAGALIGNTNLGQIETSPLIRGEQYISNGATGLGGTITHGRIENIVSEYNAGSGIALGSGDGVCDQAPNPCTSSGELYSDTTIVNSETAYNGHGIQADVVNYNFPQSSSGTACPGGSYTTCYTNASVVGITVIGGSSHHNLFSGTYLIYVDGWSINGTRFYDNGQAGRTGPGVQLGVYAHNVTISSSPIYDDQAVPTQSQGISAVADYALPAALSCAIQGISIIGNTIRPNGNHGIFLSSPGTSNDGCGSGITLGNNVVTGASTALFVGSVYTGSMHDEKYSGSTTYDVDYRAGATAWSISNMTLASSVGSSGFPCSGTCVSTGAVASTSLVATDTNSYGSNLFSNPTFTSAGSPWVWGMVSGDQACALTANQNSCTFGTIPSDANWEGSIYQPTSSLSSPIIPGATYKIGVYVYSNNCTVGTPQAFLSTGVGNIVASTAYAYGLTAGAWTYWIVQAQTANPITLVYIGFGGWTGESGCKIVTSNTSIQLANDMVQVNTPTFPGSVFAVNGFSSAPVPYSALGTEVDGAIKYCSNCTIGACGSAGTGALAVGVNGAWVCK